MYKILAKEFGRGNIQLPIIYCGILIVHGFDMGDVI